MVKNMNFTRLILCLVILIVVVSCKSKEVTLKLNFQDKDSFAIKMSINQEISQVMMGQELLTKQFMENVYLYEVIKVYKEGIYDLKTTYGSIAIDQEGPMGSMKYDSNKADQSTDPMLGIYSEMVGKSFKIKMNNMGKVLEVDGLKNIIEDVTGKMAKDKGMQGQAVLDSVKQMFNEDSIRDMMENMTAIYPDKRIKVGDTWDRIGKMTIGFPLIISTKYTLEKIDKDDYSIGFTSKINSDPDQEPVQTGPLKSMFILNGTQDGKMKLDKITGFLLSGDTVQNVSGEIKMFGSPQMPGGMVVPIKLKSNTQWERVSK